MTQAANLGALGTGASSSGVLAATNGGTGVTTSTGSGNNVLSTSPTLVTPALGTPSSVVLTNATGIPASAMAYSGAPIKISVYENSTRQVTSTVATYVAFTWTFTKLYGATTNVIIQGAIPAFVNTNDANNWFVNIDGTYKYTGTVAPDTASESQMIAVLQNWTGLASGSHTVTFGWNVADGTANRNVDVINPNATDDPRYRQNGSVFIITEVVA